MRALIVGWHHQMNTGDDAMLVVLSHALREHMGISEVSVFTTPGRLVKMPGAALNIHPLLGPLSGWLMQSGRLAIHRLSALACRDARSYDVVVFGGGSIFHSFNSIAWKQALVDYLRLVQGNSFKVCAIGVSFGPFKDPVAEVLTQRFVRQMDVVVTRDQVSFEFARSCTTQERVWVCPDISFMLKDYLRGIASDNRGRVGVCVKRSHVGAGDDRRLKETMVQAVQRLVAERGYDGATVFEFCGSRLHGDRAPSLGIMRELGRAVDVHYRPYGQSVIDMLDDVARCGVMIGMRLHSLLFAFIAGVPYVGISDQQKHVRVLAEAGGQRSILDPSSVQLLDLLWSVQKAGEENYVLHGQVEENRKRVQQTLEEALTALKAL